MLAELGSQAASTAASLGTSQWTLAIAAGVASGKKLRGHAKKLGLAVNAGGKKVKGFIAEGDELDLDDKLQMRVLNPDIGQLEGLQLKWDKQANKLRDLTKEQRLKALASITDDSLANISSIVVHLIKGDHTMLLTGDARGDHVTKGLARAGLIKHGRCHVSLLKVPHHGSDRNVDKDFFQAVTADHYVFSGDQDPSFGSNPDTTTLAMLTKVRGKARYTMHFTYLTKELRDWLATDRKQYQRRCEVSAPEFGFYGLWIDFEEELWF